MQVMAAFAYGLVNYTHQTFLQETAHHLPPARALKTKACLLIQHIYVPLRYIHVLQT